MSVQWKLTDKEISAFMQKKADQLCRMIPDKLQLIYKDERLRYRFDGWTPCMSRRELKGSFRPNGDVQGMFFKRVNLQRERIARSLVSIFFWSEAQLQIKRHASAIRLGLVGPDGFESLPPERMLIDRTLLALVKQSGWDIFGASAAASARAHRAVPFRDRESMELYLADFGELTIFQYGVDAPVMHCWHPLGQAQYNGNLLLPGFLPEVIVASAPGHRVGELVSTGIPDIDARRIKSVHLSRELNFSVDPWPPETGTWVTIEPDLVELGSAAR